MLVGADGWRNSLEGGEGGKLAAWRVACSAASQLQMLGVKITSQLSFPFRVKTIFGILV